MKSTIDIPKWVINAKDSSHKGRLEHAKHICSLADTLLKNRLPIQVIRGKVSFGLDANNKRWTLTEVRSEADRYVAAQGRWSDLKTCEYSSENKNSGWLTMNLGILGGYHRVINKNTNEKLLDETLSVGPYIIDVDAIPTSSEYKAFSNLVSNSGLKYIPGLMVRTGKGGEHYYLNLPDELKNVKYQNRIIDNVDIKCTGGYVVAPYSLHPNGNGYYIIESYEKHDMHDVNNWKPQDMPKSLIEVLLKLHTTRKQSSPVINNTYDNDNEDLCNKAFSLFAQKYPQTARVLTIREVKQNMVILDGNGSFFCPIHNRIHDS